MHVKTRYFSIASRSLMVALAATWLGTLSQATVIGPFGMSHCDLEWERIKSLPPMRKAEFDSWVNQPEPKHSAYGDAVDSYYYFARLPFVIGAEHLPTLEQRDKWLQQAAQRGHKAAKAALMRLRYLGVPDPEAMKAGHLPQPLENPQSSRENYLKAAREAAESGDPEFASVMMDTARNINSYMHCQKSDFNFTQRGDRNAYQCGPQAVTRPIETKRWAEVAARGGNPYAKNLLCVMHHFGTFPELGFEQDSNQAFAWCFVAEQSGCLAGSNAGLLASMYEKGVGTSQNKEKAKEIRSRYPEPVLSYKHTSFPLVTR